MDNKQQQELQKTLQGLLAIATPLTRKLYFFVTWINNSYITLALTPLYPDFVISKPCFIHIELGNHLFKVKCDQTVWMIPYNSDGLSKMALGDSYEITDKEDPAIKYVCYEGFTREVEKLFAFQIQNQALYQRQADDTWVKVEMPGQPK